MGHKFCLAQSGTKEKKESGLARSEVDNFNIKCESYSKNNLYGKELLFFFLASLSKLDIGEHNEASTLQRSY